MTYQEKAKLEKQKALEAKQWRDEIITQVKRKQAKAHRIETGLLVEIPGKTVHLSNMTLGSSYLSI